MSLGRNVIRLGGIVVLLLGWLLGLGAPASASPAIPGIPDCKDAPAAQLPGYGLPGFLDGKPDPLPAQGDPFTKNPTTSVYEQYGYAGLTWHTYDLGCGGDLRDVNASTDTMIGNATLAFATWGVAGANGLHNKIAHPSDYMAPLGDVVTAVSTRIKDAIWSPWGGAALLGVVVLLPCSRACSLGSVNPSRKLRRFESFTCHLHLPPGATGMSWQKSSSTHWTSLAGSAR